MSMKDHVKQGLALGFGTCLTLWGIFGAVGGLWFADDAEKVGNVLGMVLGVGVSGIGLMVAIAGSTLIAHFIAELFD